MKDPLQRESTPYEILNVSYGAERGEVEKAFKLAVARGAPVNQITEARRCLLDPAKRARHRIITYDDAFLKDIDPSPIADPSFLSSAKRGRTAALWSKRHKETLPDPRITHALGILWYWWAVYEGDRLLHVLDTAAQKGPLPNGRLSKRVLIEHVQNAVGTQCDTAKHQTCAEPDCVWKSDCTSSAPPLEDIWEHVIAFWSMLETDNKFWKESSGLPDSDAAALRSEFMEGLEHRLLDLSQACADRLNSRHMTPQHVLELIPDLSAEHIRLLRKAGFHSPSDIIRAGLVRLTALDGLGGSEALAIISKARQLCPEDDHYLPFRFRSLALVMQTERKTAKAMHQTGVRTARGKLCCGSLMLRHLDMLTIVREQVKSAMGNASNGQVQTLYDALSPYYAIATLISSRNLGSAFEAIEHLPKDEQNTAEVLRLRVRALHTLGMEESNLGQYGDALKTWKSALDISPAHDIRSSIETDIVSMCHEQAIRLQETRLGEAIDLLELAETIVSNEKLRLLLGELLARRGVKRFLEGREKADRLPQGVSEIEKQASEAFGRKDWSVAVDKLRSALAASNARPDTPSYDESRVEGLRLCEAGIADLERALHFGATRAQESINQGRDVLKDLNLTWRQRLTRYLVSALTQKAIDAGNRVVEQLNQQVQRRDAELERIASAGRRIALLGGIARCASCMGVAQYTFRSQDGSAIGFCATHAAAFENLLKPIAPTQAMMAALKSAEQDLREAVRLDPSSEHAKENLRRITKLTEDVGTTPQRQSQTTPKTSSASSGCFIATACYGSYESPEVVELRHFRDEVLAGTQWGRDFIRLYYAYSPSLADYLRNRTFVRQLVRMCFLSPLVKLIGFLRKGVESNI